MIFLTFNNRVRKHRNIYSQFFYDTPTKIILSHDAYNLLQSKVDNFRVDVSPLDGKLFLYGMLVLKSDKLSKYEFILK